MNMAQKPAAKPVYLHQWRIGPKPKTSLTIRLRGKGCLTKVQITLGRA